MINHITFSGGDGEAAVDDLRVVQTLLWDYIQTRVPEAEHEAVRSAGMMISTHSHGFEESLACGWERRMGTTWGGDFGFVERGPVLTTPCAPVTPACLPNAPNAIHMYQCKFENAHY
jgi:hypothetical protein